MKEYIYVASIKDSSDQEYVKIGKTTKVQERINGLQTGCPFPIVLIRLYEFNHLSSWNSQKNSTPLEKLIHKSIERYRSNGEWFKMSERAWVDLQEVLDELCDYSIEIEENCYRSKIKQMLKSGEINV